MGLFSLEHSKAAYWLDFAVYGSLVAGLAALLLFVTPRAQGWEIAAFALFGLAGWTAIEYALHRFVLHGLDPFRRWHAEHHERPHALICAPTLFSASLIAVLIFLPALLLGGVWRACAITLGVLAGYLAYAITHHATHHWRTDNAWLRRVKVNHARHHHTSLPPGAYGVTSAFWDHVFRSNSGPRSGAR